MISSYRPLKAIFSSAHRTREMPVLHHEVIVNYAKCLRKFLLASTPLLLNKQMFLFAFWSSHILNLIQLRFGFIRAIVLKSAYFSLCRMASGICSIIHTLPSFKSFRIIELLACCTTLRTRYTTCFTWLADRKGTRAMIGTLARTFTVLTTKIGEGFFNQTGLAYKGIHTCLLTRQVSSMPGSW